MSQVLKETHALFLAARQQQTLEALPQTATNRALTVLKHVFGGPRLLLLVFAGVGLFYGAPAVRFAAGSALLLFLAYLPYAHTVQWTVYYLEAVPVLAALTGVGVTGLGARLGEKGRAASAGALAAAIVLAGAIGLSQARYQRLHSLSMLFQREIDATIPKLPSPGILFVRYSPRLRQNFAIVRNSARLDHEAMWIVHDLGPRNEELRRLAPSRATHVLDIDRMLPRSR